MSAGHLDNSRVRCRSTSFKDTLSRTLPTPAFGLPTGAPGIGGGGGTLRPGAPVPIPGGGGGGGGIDMMSPKQYKASLCVQVENLSIL